jgi:hypothetical protein
MTRIRPFTTYIVPTTFILTASFFLETLATTNTMAHPQTLEQCAKQALFFTKLSTNNSAWIALSTMIPIVVFSAIIIFTVASWGTTRSIQRRRYIISTVLLVLIGVLAFFLNTAFMHMKSCQPPVPEDLGAAATMAVFGGDLAAGIALLAWLIGTHLNIKTWKKEQKRRALQAQGQIDNLELQDCFSIPVANKESSRSSVQSERLNTLMEPVRISVLPPTPTVNEGPSKPALSYHSDYKSTCDSSSQIPADPARVKGMRRAGQRPMSTNWRSDSGL